MGTVVPNGSSYCILLPINTTYFSAEYIQIIYETKLKLEQLYSFIHTIIPMVVPFSIKLNFLLDVTGSKLKRIKGCSVSDWDLSDVTSRSHKQKPRVIQSTIRTGRSLLYRGLVIRYRDGLLIAISCSYMVLTYKFK